MEWARTLERYSIMRFEADEIKELAEEMAQFPAPPSMPLLAKFKELIDSQWLDDC